VKSDPKQSAPNKKRAGATPASFEDVGRRVDEEFNEFVRWFNDDVVPQARKHSSRALRTAAEKLAEFADFMDQAKRGK
jgi:hypothetical protein